MITMITKKCPFSIHRTEECVQQFVKLIEEPHNGQAMHVINGQQSQLIQDQTKTFREENGIEDMFFDLVKTATNND